MQTLKATLEQGAPYYGMHGQIPTEELEHLGWTALEATAEARVALLDAIRKNSSDVITFGDLDDPASKNRYVSFTANDGGPCYRKWNTGDKNTDIGFRMASPDYEGDELNPITVMHADALAPGDLERLEAPSVVTHAAKAVTEYRSFIVSKVIKPFLHQLAEEYGMNPTMLEEQLYPPDRRDGTLARAILYHADAPEATRPVGDDDQRLALKAHADRSLITVDGFQTSHGLEYLDLQTKEWKPARPDAVAVFLGKSAARITPPDGSIWRPTIHRVKQIWVDPATKDPRLPADIDRGALPVFGNLVSPLLTPPSLR